MSPGLCTKCDRASCVCAPAVPTRRWQVKVYPDRAQWPKNSTAKAIARWTSVMSATFVVRADNRDEALHVGQEHRPDLKGCIWEIEEVRS